MDNTIQVQMDEIKADIKKLISAVKKLVLEKKVTTREMMYYILIWKN